MGHDKLEQFVSESNEIWIKHLELLCRQQAKRVEMLTIQRDDLMPCYLEAMWGNHYNYTKKWYEEESDKRLSELNVEIEKAVGEVK